MNTKLWKLKNKLMKLQVSNKDQKEYWEHKNNNDDFFNSDQYDEGQNFVSLWDAVTEDIDFKNKRTLDVGTGAGFWKRRMEDRGADVIGLDYAREGYDVIKADIKTFEDEPYTIINCSRVLIHMNYYEQNEALVNLWKLLDDDGLLIILEKNKTTSLTSHGREWVDALYFYGFVVEEYKSDGVIQAIVARKDVDKDSRLTDY